MNIKHILSIFALALPMLLCTSCLKDQEDVFDQSSSTRLENDLNNIKSILRGSEYGWVIDYYVGDNATYGGYAYTVKFDSLSCTAMSEVTDTIVSTSYYKMTNDDGPILTFDTYNYVMHILATPGVSGYEGYHADFEFKVLSATPDLILLKGKKIGNLMSMRPLQEPAKDYLDKVKKVEDGMVVTSGKGRVGDKDIKAEFDLDNREITLTADNDTASCPFTYTDTGFRLYETLTVAGRSVSAFTYDATTRNMSCTDNGSTDLVLTGIVPDDYVMYDDFAGDYYFVCKESTSDGTQEVKIDVTLTPSGDGTTYKMSGLSSAWDVTLEYNKSQGSLAMYTQQVATLPDGNELWLNGADASGSLYPGLTLCGMRTKWNMDSEHPIYEWVNIENDYISVNAFCLWMFLDGEQNGQFTDNTSEYAFTGGRRLLLDVTSLIKK